MLTLKKGLWCILFIAFLIGLLQFFRLAFHYSSIEESELRDSNIKNKIMLEVDEIVREIVLEKIEDKGSTYMVGTFKNTTGYDIPSLRVLYEIRGIDGGILREGTIKIGKVLNGNSAELKIDVTNMFDYTINITSSTNLGL